MLSKIIIIYLITSNFLFKNSNETNPFRTDLSNVKINSLPSTPEPLKDTITFNYENISIPSDSNYVYIFEFDRINSINSTLYANRSNYSSSVFCYNQDNLVYTIDKLTCDEICTFYQDMYYFVNKCKFVIHSSDAFHRESKPLLLYDINITINYEGSHKNITIPSPLPVGGSPSPSSQESPTPTLENKGLSPGTIAGIVVGCIVIVGLVTTGCYFLYRHFNQNARVVRN